MPDRLAFALLLFLACAPSVRAEPPCPLPPDATARSFSLPIARRVAAQTHKLVILTFGGDHTAGTDAGAQGATYPARLEADLQAALPDLSVIVRNAGVPGSSAADVPPMLPDLIEKYSANLVIWGPGGRDIALRQDVRAFRDTITRGIDATRHGGADLVLMDTLFIPSTARMTVMEPYRAEIKKAAEASHVAFLPRHDLMKHWVETGTLNLAVRDATERQAVARRLFACIAESLAGPIASGLR